MKIGILAYNSACNFGANLQLLSTVEFLKHNGHTPCVINWCPLSLEKVYETSTPREQFLVHKDFREKYYNETSLCRTAKDVADVIMCNEIEAVIIGSDAVSQHHPLISRIHFPAKTIVSILPITEERTFPNVFWGTFNSFLERRVPLALMSTSCQNSDFKHFGKRMKTDMYESIKQFCYISVRDKWTQDMFSYISDGNNTPTITPDPVFAFNNNVDFVPTREEILNKYSLPEKYFLFGLHNKKKINNEWIREFEILANNNGYTCTNLPFPAQLNPIYPFKTTIKLPLDPIDWYALIKYSSGYIGHNMHPIVVAIHNCVPFYCIDHYGVLKCFVSLQKKSSKIYDILHRAGFDDNRSSDGFLSKSLPSPMLVFSIIKEFNINKCETFRNTYYKAYQSMMNSIMDSFNKCK